MDIMRIAGVSVTAALTALVIRRIKPEFSAAIALCAGVLLLLISAPEIAQMIDSIVQFTSSGNVAASTTAALLKITGISLLSDFAARTCRDAGESGIAAHTELAGRIAILTLTLPSMKQLIELILTVSA